MDAGDVVVAGKVGIGTTTPGANLEIAGHSGTTTMIVDGKDIVASDYPMQIISNSTGLTFGDNDGNTLGRMLRLQDLNQGTFYDQGIDGSDNYFLEVGNSSLESLVLNPNGNVGIGTTTPNATLQVVGTLVAGNGGTATGTNAVLRLVMVPSQVVTIRQLAVEAAIPLLAPVLSSAVADGMVRQRMATR